MKFFNESKKTRKYTPETSETAADDSESPALSRFLVHNGQLAKTLPLFPAVGTNVLSSGWNPTKLRALKQAIQQLVVQNPILSGIVVMERDGIYIEPGMYNPDSHTFWTDVLSSRNTGKAVDPRTIRFLEDYVVPSLHTMRANQKLRFMQNHVAPLLPKVTSMKEEAKKKLPVFQVYLVPLAGGHLVYSIRISHAVGDAATYFALVNQLSHLLQGEGNKAPIIDWEAPARKTHEGQLKNQMSAKDAKSMRSAPLKLPRASKGGGYVLLSRSKINRRKQQLCADDVEYLTTNAIVVAALCQSNPKVKSFCQIVNGRSKEQELDGGNFLQAIPFPRGAAVDPNNVRRMARDGKYLEAPSSSMASRSGRIANWSGLCKNLQMEGITTHVEVLPEDFVKSLPLDTAVKDRKSVV